ncbi:MAG: hypothetical protein PHS79_03995 [Patescibacteria group bacterium]|nr:hypothetical protein [Patescibacteria group bacterium]
MGEKKERLTGAAYVSAVVSEHIATTPVRPMTIVDSDERNRINWHSIDLSIVTISLDLLNCASAADAKRRNRLHAQVRVGLSVQKSTFEISPFVDHALSQVRRQTIMQLFDLWKKLREYIASGTPVPDSLKQEALKLHEEAFERLSAHSRGD